MPVIILYVGDKEVKKTQKSLVELAFHQVEADTKKRVKEL